MTAAGPAPRLPDSLFAKYESTIASAVAVLLGLSSPTALASQHTAPVPAPSASALSGSAQWVQATTPATTVTGPIISPDVSPPSLPPCGPENDGEVVEYDGILWECKLLVNVLPREWEWIAIGCAVVSEDPAKMAGPDCQA